MFMDQLHEALILLWRMVRLQRLYVCLHFDLSFSSPSLSLTFFIPLPLFFLPPSPATSSLHLKATINGQPLRHDPFAPVGRQILFTVTPQEVQYICHVLQYNVLVHIVTI